MKPFAPHVLSFFFLILLVCLLAPTARAEAREWTSTEGKKIEAEFISSRDGKVTLQRPGARPMTFSLSKLSQADQDWVKEQVAARPGLGPKPDPKKSGKEKTNEYTKSLTGKWEKLEDSGLQYRLFGERKLKGTKLYPLVVYLHGRGGDVMTPEAPWPAKFFGDGANYKKRPCFIIAPQCIKNQSWNGGNNGKVVAIIEKLIKNLPIDEDRIYVTGYSMGGYGTFDIVASEPKMFAAAVPVAGGGNPSAASKMKKTPFWVYHGDADDVVKVTESQKMVEAIKKARGSVEYTEIKGGGHGVGGKIYPDEKLHEWIFSQVRGKKPEKR